MSPLQIIFNSREGAQPWNQTGLFFKFLLETHVHCVVGTPLRRKSLNCLQHTTAFPSSDFLHGNLNWGKVGV